MQIKNYKWLAVKIWFPELVLDDKTKFQHKSMSKGVFLNYSDDGKGRNEYEFIIIRRQLNMIERQFVQLIL